ncbi:hypothetical protein L3556_00865 [Candidatus Synechococcus calcipolaris G9]|uniref:Uncharacterized protein n=1 Tax=Candidatus Synechococcus calcipolaris G9 TaxID=1497997 RepID=A0ABT6EUD3_9SYNE|nr:hypothetical protein [Candidatus Synechococcus calcipolaris]MDG2989489.1 hypothetical protein [Candidatus Synechococcus calcipolaris G9]
MLNFEYFDASGNTVAQGVFLPVASLPGLEADELAPAAADKESKAVLAVLTAIQLFLLSNPGTLGFNLIKSTPTGPQLDTINEQFTATVGYLANHANNSMGPVPLPTTGNFNGLGGLAIDDVFPNASKLNAEASTGSAGILIPSSLLVTHGSPAHGDLDVEADSRLWFGSLVLYLASNVVLRNAQNASAIVSRAIGNNTGATIPATWTATPNPLSGIQSSELPLLSLFNRNYAITIQQLIDPEDQTLDVNHI